MIVGATKKAPAQLVEAVMQELNGHKAANHCRLFFDNSQIQFQKYRTLESHQVSLGYEPSEFLSLSPGDHVLNDGPRRVNGV